MDFGDRVEQLSESARLYSTKKRDFESLTQNEITEISQDIEITKQKYYGKDQNAIMSGLTKPKSPAHGYMLINNLIVEKIWKLVCVNKIHAFFTQHELQKYVENACQHDYKQIMKSWGFTSLTKTIDLSMLAIYDLILVIDDSGSMLRPEGYITRADIARHVTQIVSYVGSLMDDSGIEIRFMNSNLQGNNVKDCKYIDDLMVKASPINGNGTPLGYTLRKKVFEDIISNPLRHNKLKKPVCVMIITDGAPSDAHLVIDTFKHCKNAFAQSKYGKEGICFGISQIGSDDGATKYLDSLDKHPEVGDIVDCTSEFSIEKEKCPSLTENTWIMKLLLGPIDPDYDASDESSQNVGNMTMNYPIAPPVGYPIV